MDKQAYEHMMGSVLNKSASSYVDSLGEIITSSIPYVNVGNTIGAVAGYLEEPTGRKELEGLNKANTKNKSYSLIPGIGAYRNVKRITNTHKAYGAKSSRAKAIHQAIGPATQVLLSSLIGAGIGGVVGGVFGDNIGVGKVTGIAGGAGIGMSAGAAIGAGSQLVGALAAALTRTRTAEEQRKASTQGSARNYLIPGYGTYDHFKTLGHSNYVSMDPPSNK